MSGPRTWTDAVDATLADVRAAITRIWDQRAQGRHVTVLNPARDAPYEAFFRSRLETRQREYRVAPEPGLLSLITPVYDGTPPTFFDELASDLVEQDVGPTFEWVVVDNGCRSAGMLEVLRRVAERSWVRVVRLDENVGIIRAMRHALEHATGRYIVPVDADDRLTPDGVRILTSSLKTYRYPAILYTDEHQSDGTSILDYSIKPDWDPVMFENASYISHLTAFDRVRALELGVYSDVKAEGCPDWDTFTRFMLSGEQPVHIPEDVYSFRAHSMSTAGGSLARKPYIEESHFHVLRAIVGAQPHPARFRVEHSPIVDNPFDCWIRRARIDPVGITTLVLGGTQPADLAIDPVIPHTTVTVPSESTAAELRSLVAHAERRGDLVHLLRGQVVPSDDEWAWEAAGLFERFSDAAMVGGVMLRTGQVIDAGRYLGFGWGCASPLSGRGLFEPGYGGLYGWKQHSVSAVSASHAVCDAAFLGNALEWLAQVPDVTLDDLGSWLGLSAARAGRRVIYSPYLSACCPTIDAHPSMRPVEIQSFLRAAVGVMPDTRFLSPHASLTTPFTAATGTEREAHLNDLYRDLGGFVAPSGRPAATHRSTMRAGTPATEPSAPAGIDPPAHGLRSS
jgi:hypothetical protein